ncbi:class IV adenylate cyclase [Halobacteriales archaeon QS_8_69_26]|nr:MAG: class IV adenylate cyclase [Halobacteriales archaeon QS_8_69_26]
MFEVELKLRADHAPVRERLVGMGADPVRAVRQVDTYYDAPDRSFADTDEALRIRREEPLEAGSGDDATPDGNGVSADGSALLTYKGPKVGAGSKTREEVETPVDPDDMATVLDRLGYGAVATVHKERTVYAVEDHEVTLDAVRGLGEFVEVETEAPEDRIDAAREGVRDLADRLGLDPDDGITDAYLELLLADDDLDGRS